MNLSDYTYYLVRQIPAGRVSTYGAVAKALGNKRYARVVGKYMNKNPDADTMPCFKIVKSDGSLGGFGLGINDKIRRLKKDGIDVKDGKIINFKRVFFNDFKTKYPLKKNKS
jgi:O-6-methylguanine DNA methyltransferase